MNNVDNVSNIVSGSSNLVNKVTPSPLLLAEAQAITTEFAALYKQYLADGPLFTGVPAASYVGIALDIETLGTVASIDPKALAIQMQSHPLLAVALVEEIGVVNYLLGVIADGFTDLSAPPWSNWINPSTTPETLTGPVGLAVALESYITSILNPSYPLPPLNPNNIPPSFGGVR